MLKTLQNAFKVKDVRHRIFYVLMMLVVIRIGSQLPVPGVDGSYFKTWFESQTGDAFNFLDAFTGGSFSQMSIFALSITPYITSSIIIQLLTIAIPKLEEMQRDGEDGRKKLGAITRYVTIGLSLFESIAMAIGFGNKGLIPDNSFVKMVVVVVALTAGSAFLMWVGEQINEKGVGNGISIVLLINIVSRIPSDMTKLYESFMKGKIIAKALLSGVIIAAIIVGVVVAYKLIYRTTQGRLTIDRIKMKMPLFGKLTVKTACSQFARTMSTLLMSGISTIDALETTSKIVNNIHYTNAMLKAREEVMKGVPLSEPLEASGIFPPMVYHMTGIGEETGNVEEMLEKMADYYDEEVEMTTQSVLAAMEPIIILFMALIIGTLVIAVISPIASMYNGLDNL